MSDSPPELAAWDALRRENEELRIRLAEAEEALAAIRGRDAETACHLAVETMAEAALHLTVEGRILSCNPRFCEFVERPLPQVVGHNLLEFISPDHAGSLRQLLAECLIHPVQQRIEFLGAGGGIRATRVSARALNQAEAVSLCLVVADITEWESALRQIDQLRQHRDQLSQSQEELSAARLAALTLMEDAVDARERAEGTALALRDSEERFRGTFENAAVGMAHVALNGQWLRVNQKLCDITGYSREELHCLTFAQITHPDDLQADLELARQLLNGDISHYSIDKRYVRKDATEIWIGLTGSLQRRWDGEPEYFIAVVRDISDRKRFEAELRDGERFIRRVLDQLFAFVGVLDRNARLIEVNRAPLEIAGLKEEDVLGKKFWETYWWSHDENIQAGLEQICARAFSGEVIRYDVPARIAGDEIIWIDFQIAPLRDDHGEITHLIPSAMDITARRDAEQALQASEERLRLAAEATGFGSYDYDPVRQTSVWSHHLYAITGVSQDSSVSYQVMHDLVHPEDRQRFEGMVRESQGGSRGGRHEIEFRLRHHQTGEVRWVRDVGQTFFEEDSATGASRSVRVVGTVQDITWRKQAELQLEESFRSLQIAQDELVRRERLATLGQLAGGVAHELRTPLGILRNSVYYLEHVLSMEDQTMREVLGEMQRAIGSSDHIIGEMLDYVREPSRERTSFAVGDAIKRALHAVPFPAGVNLQGPSGERSARVLASQDQVTRILVNLLQNSIQALSHSGSIEIIVCRADNEVWIDVGDTGCGIPPENLERIFDPLFTTKTRGIGLGLAISRRYARLQGGALTVKSTPGEGTIFRLALPGAPD